MTPINDPGLELARKIAAPRGRRPGSSSGREARFPGVPPVNLAAVRDLIEVALLAVSPWVLVGFSIWLVAR